MDTDQVLGIIKQVSADIVEPRFRALHEDEIDSKAPGDYVTVADREAERALSQQLRAGARDAVVVGEEGSFVDPGQLDAIGVAPHCFVVDPLDGTNNFVRGSEDFAVMVAELRGVETVGAWIYQPRAGKAYVATRGGGVYCNGERMSAAPIHVPPQGASTFRAWRGFDEEGRIAPVIPASGSAGIDYPHVVTAAIDFVVYRFPKPWDHLPGQLMLQELGGDVVHLDGRLYRPGSGRMAILSCRDLATGRRVASGWPRRD
ncbi:inositol monophosphatase [Propionibacterium freudenreichii]|uniref:inositol monophosphatase family protein n=1 Tax=Propionibacterium freudenreichii TaxID=1744 RepID=UPI000BC2D1EB|nr:inositol monophosphatase [Propionibacterium freudenreichii]MDK9295935.1 inositol monophosphatase [Propionibacterium freudenreichii]MDK9361326.1 inositol monophosphatase [Propionibacterium freudenreichii]MDK9639439.1 inositol monophosphatase [Propionibacterium freudenreichii]MDK9660838.1 inositol monophosphatase [Propionibacterium freudenreichii]WGU89432.1 inositol monophosphatase [Propionibacterium freudenreichii]